MESFHSFTAEGMRHLGEDLAAARQHRVEAVRQARASTLTTLSDFRARLREQADARRKRGEQEADARRLFTSELKSGVHAFMSRCGLNRAEMAADLRATASDIEAAKEAWRSRPR